MLRWLSRSLRAVLPVLTSMVITVADGGIACGGGGPENVFVVVNPRSWASMAIANHFCDLRRVPPSNVFYLDWKGGPASTTIDGFRRVILEPIRAEIVKRQLDERIDYIIYSSDFPYEIRFDGDLPRPQKYSSGSITGLTYLAELVLRKDPAYTGGVNWYMRLPRERGINLGRIPETVDMPTHGFRSRYQFEPQGQLVTGSDQPSQRYILSAMLGYTSGHGNSVDEVIRYLRRSAMADGTHPRGTVYFMLAPNSDPRRALQQPLDIRSTAREPAFDGTVRELTAMGINARVVSGQPLPHNDRRVLGVMTGTRVFDWQSSGSVLLPGAICDNLTSFAGDFDNNSQTQLSEFLRYGAAGAGGTVVEPYLIWMKFPHPMVFVHYARGCTLAESFYQSVYSPYQLLIVGDPLCRPWASIPAVTLDGAKAGQTVSGRLALTPAAKTSPGTGIERFELFVDGRYLADCQPGAKFEWDTTSVGDGYHELRVVAIESSAIQSQGRLIVPVVVDNQGKKMAWDIRPRRSVAWERPITVGARAEGSREIAIIQGRRIVGRISGDRGQVRIQPNVLGPGPVTLQAVGLNGDDPREHVFGRPIRLQVSSPVPIATIGNSPRLPQSDELWLKRSDGSQIAIGSAAGKNWLTKAGVRVNEPFEIDGYLDVPTSGTYQFELQYQGRCTVYVDGVIGFDETNNQYQHYHAPIGLQQGQHRVRIRGKLEKTPKFFVAFGNRGTWPVTSDRFKRRYPLKR